MEDNQQDEQQDNSPSLDWNLPSNSSHVFYGIIGAPGSHKSYRYSNSFDHEGRLEKITYRLIDNNGVSWSQDVFDYKSDTHIEVQHYHDTIKVADAEKYTYILDKDGYVIDSRVYYIGIGRTTQQLYSYNEQGKTTKITIKYFVGEIPENSTIVEEVEVKHGSNYFEVNGSRYVQTSHKIQQPIDIQYYLVGVESAFGSWRHGYGPKLYSNYLKERIENGFFDSPKKYSYEFDDQGRLIRRNFENCRLSPWTNEITPHETAEDNYYYND